jgi:hypothetical protein
MSIDLSRRSVLLGGCGFAALLAMPLDAQAAFGRQHPAPRHRCPHQGCRHFRRDGGEGDGTCALSIHGVVPQIEVS